MVPGGGRGFSQRLAMGTPRGRSWQLPGRLWIRSPGWCSPCWDAGEGCEAFASEADAVAVGDDDAGVVQDPVDEGVGSMVLTGGRPGHGPCPVWWT